MPRRATSTALLDKIRTKYKEYGIKEKPFVIVKADAGTYGMGIMTVKDADGSERPEPQAAQQDGGGEGRPGSHDVIMQEGVHTFEHINDAVAEPVVYMIDRYVVGGFYKPTDHVAVDHVDHRLGHRVVDASRRSARLPG